VACIASERATTRGDIFLAVCRMGVTPSLKVGRKLDEKLKMPFGRCFILRKFGSFCIFVYRPLDMSQRRFHLAGELFDTLPVITETVEQFLSKYMRGREF